MSYRQQDNDLSEFDESREVIESLVEEYKACESPDYIKWGMEVGHPECSCLFELIFSETIAHHAFQSGTRGGQRCSSTRLEASNVTIE